MTDAERIAHLDADNARMATELIALRRDYAEALQHVDDNARAATHEGSRAERLRVALENVRLRVESARRDLETVRLQAGSTNHDRVQCAINMLGAALTRLTDEALAAHAQQPSTESMPAQSESRAMGSGVGVAPAVTTRGAINLPPPACGCDALVAALEAIDRVEAGQSGEMRAIAREALAAHAKHPAPRASDYRERVQALCAAIDDYDPERQEVNRWHDDILRARRGLLAEHPETPAEGEVTRG
jgi:hypothetical protein